jgi:primosomal protein N' (replication factor Y)
MSKGKLTLKRELAPRIALPPQGEFTVAQVWVDASVYHLDTTFSYLIPGNLTDQVKVGSLLTVPFHGRDVSALAIEIIAPESISGLKNISKVIGGVPLLTPEIIALISSAANRYAAHPFDLIRSAVPDRAVAVERELASLEDRYESVDGSSIREYFQLPPHKERSALMAMKIKERSDKGGVLMVLPDSTEVSRLSLQLNILNVEHVVIDSSIPKSELYSNFLKARLGVVNVVIGTRSAIFAPISKLRTVMIYNDGSENFYEKRSPGWNVRDIALLRSRVQDFDLLFIGYSPSSEVARLIDEQWVDYKRSRGKVKVNTFTPERGELLPSRALAPIKKALATGPVLFIVPLKGYAQAIRCAQCRTVSRCTCGGAHEKLSQSAPISCNHCLLKVAEWRCAWCHSERTSIQSRGADRHQYELGLLFPSVKSVVSTSEHPITSIVDSGIVVATPGMAPTTGDGYAAVIFLEGNRFLNQPDMRANERVREMFFAHAALTAQGGSILCIQDEGHSITTALTTWNPSIAIHRELEERKSLSLPPYVRAAKLTMDHSEITRLQGALLAAREEGRIPATAKILGPVSNGEKSSLIITVDVIEGDALITTIHEFMRRRSTSKKVLPSLRIDPYSLSH